jgi:hypothetical protein
MIGLPREGLAVCRYARAVPKENGKTSRQAQCWLPVAGPIVREAGRRAEEVGFVPRSSDFRCPVLSPARGEGVRRTSFAREPRGGNVANFARPGGRRGTPVSAWPTTGKARKLQFHGSWGPVRSWMSLNWI